MNPPFIDLEHLVSLEMAIGCMKRLYRHLHQPALHRELLYETPLRSVLSLPAAEGQQKFLGLMPCVVSDSGSNETLYFGSKCLSVFLGGKKACSTHKGIYILFEGAHGDVLCTLDAAHLTALRTAASSAVAAQALLPAIGCAGPGIQRPLHLGIIGTGEQARRHAASLTKVFARTDTPVARISIWGRSSPHAQACLRDLLAAGFSNIHYKEASNIAEIVAQSDILCTVTSSPTPLIKIADFEGRKKGQAPLLILAVGACTATNRELEPAVVAEAQRPFVVDTLRGALREAGDLLAPEVLAHLGCNQASLEDYLVPLSTAVAEGYPGAERTPVKRSIIFKSVGFGAQDLALAICAYQAAQQFSERR
jgi:ornithine cyclodeaminase/alanine dehydrogenase-like protein (mu-crystallin family)